MRGRGRNKAKEEGNEMERMNEYVARVKKKKKKDKERKINGSRESERGGKEMDEYIEKEIKS